MKTGLFFGSFNPIHNGHLIVAQHMLSFAGFSKILFVVSPHNPFKEKDDLWDAKKRLNLVKTAISDNPNFEVSDIEFSMPSPNYSIDTLDALKALHPEMEFQIIMGSDNISGLNKWKNSEQLLTKYKFQIYQRPGSENIELPNDNFTLHKAPLIDISATVIRELLSKGHSVKYLVPESILELVDN
ncbi:MAG: nicotinate-nucleotide adenylyltransferase [Bacteroidia bacterium]|nr:nicotinate-nucleotide adenylyltransferase [Bacteroidia bacterium]